MNRIKTVQCFHALIEEVQSMPGAVKRNITSLDFEEPPTKKTLKYEYDTPAIMSQATAANMIIRCIEFKNPLDYSAPLKLTAKDMVDCNLFPVSSYHQTESLLASSLVVGHTEDSVALMGRIVKVIEKELQFLKTRGLGYGLLECSAYTPDYKSWRTSLSLRIGELIPGFNKEIHGFVLIDSPVPKK